MSTTETQLPETASTQGNTGKVKAIAIGFLCAVLVVFLGLEGMSLLAAQRTESQRRAVGMAGGECKMENRIPDWIKTVAGEDFHSFMDYPVIVGVTLSGSKIDNDNLARLPDMPDLQALDLHDSQVTSDGLHVIPQWKNIKTLDIGNTPITDITPLAELPNLGTLQLNFSQVRREYLSGLSQLEQIRELGAGYIQVTDAEVIEIAKCPQLEVVNIAAGDLGEHGLQPLVSLPNLKTLVLKDTKFNAADFQEFQTNRPDVKILK